MQGTRQSPVAYHSGEAIQIDGLRQHGVETTIRILEVLPVRGHAIDRHGLRTRAVAESLAGFDTAHSRHPDVEEHDIRPEQRRLPQRFAPVGNGANEESEQGEKSLDEQPAVIVIICYQNTKPWRESGPTHENVAILTVVLRE